MRKLNMVLVIGIIAAFLTHAIMGGLRLAGADTRSPSAAAWVCFGLIAAHVVVTTILTGRTLAVWKRTGAGYFRENALFWARRISGFVVLIPLVMHLVFFSTSNEGAFRLQVFTAGRLISQILLVVAIALHLLTNVAPLLITLGVREKRAFAADLLLILSVMLLLFAAAFVIYYLRWTAY